MGYILLYSLHIHSTQTQIIGEGIDNRDINIYTKVDHINARTRVSFNFSFNIHKISHFKSLISKYPIYDLYECAKKIMLKTYKTELEV